MPYRRPRPPTQQDAYNLRLQQQFEATRRAAPPVPNHALPTDALRELAALHDSGVLDDEEFAAAKAKLLA